MNHQNKTITVKINGRPVLSRAGLALSEIIKGEKPCGGHGKCGKCRVTARGELSPLTDSEKAVLGADEMARGVRLACLTVALGDCEVEGDFADEGAQIVADGAPVMAEIKPSFSRFGVAVDIGTTTIASQLYNSLGELLATATRLNPQSEWGADVVSRMEAALGGNASRLAASVREAIDGIICELAASAGIETCEIDGAVITGNTIMLCLLTEESVEPLSHAPFEAKRLFGESLCADALGLASLKPDTEIYLPPCMSAFVGADITCAVMASDLCRCGRALLVDIGTNGEMALWQNGKLSTCSTAAGPAFEGVGISAGMRGSLGAIDKVTVESGNVRAHVIGEGSAIGICGSGLVDAVACMLELEAVDETGFMEDEPFALCDSVEITQDDIRAVQLAKSAVCAGMMTLADSHNAPVDELEAVYIAGGFGSYLNTANAEKIGLLPNGVSKKSTSIGNAALRGASMLLLNTDLKSQSQSLAQGAETLELSTNKMFSDLYINGMFF